MGRRRDRQLLAPTVRLVNDLLHDKKNEKKVPHIRLAPIEFLPQTRLLALVPLYMCPLLALVPLYMCPLLVLVPLYMCAQQQNMRDAAAAGPIELLPQTRLLALVPLYMCPQ
jgi:hypothetical protein